MKEIILVIVIYGFVAAVMCVIGLVQFLSKKPVGFYSGEKPPKPEGITDLRAWNRKHGAMWLIYGAFIFACGVVGALLLETVLCLIPLSCGLLIPVLIMIWYHDRLVKLYLKKPPKN